MLTAGVAATILLALAVLAAPAARGQELRTHHGLETRPLPNKVLATSAQTVLLNIDLTQPRLAEGTLIDKLEDILLEESPGLQRVTEDIFEQIRANEGRLVTHMRQIDFVAKQQQRRRGRRARRSPLDFIGRGLGFCCGFSTYEDQLLLEERDEVLREQLAAIEAVVMKINLASKHNVDILEETNEKVADAIVIAFNKTGGDLQKHVDLATKLHLLSVAHASQSVDMLLFAEKMASIQESCSRGLLPAAVVSRDVLEETVLKVNKKYEGSARVAVSSPDMLYRLDIAKCFFNESTNEMAVAVKVPLLSTVSNSASSWSAHDIVPLNFLHEAAEDGTTPKVLRVCQLLPHPMVAVVAKDAAGVITDVRLMSREQRALCLARAICDVPRVTEAADVGSECVWGILRGAGAEELRAACAFTCRPFERVQVTHLENNRYSVVNADRALAVRCVDRPQPIPVPPQTVGALLVDLPCNCSLADGGRVLVERALPCDPRLGDNVTFSIQVPKLWTANESFPEELLQKYNHSTRRWLDEEDAVKFRESLVFRVRLMDMPEPTPVVTAAADPLRAAAWPAVSWLSSPEVVSAWMVGLTVVVVLQWLRIHTLTAAVRYRKV